MTWTGTTRKKHQTSTRQPFFSAPKAFGVNNRHHNPVLFWTAVGSISTLRPIFKARILPCLTYNLKVQCDSPTASAACRKPNASCSMLRHPQYILDSRPVYGYDKGSQEVIPI